MIRLVATALLLTACSSQSVASSSQDVRSHRLHVMPLGDHMLAPGAEGDQQRSGWRLGLWQRMAGQLDYVGGNFWGPTALPDKQWEGREDFATHDLTQYIAAWLAQDNPDLVIVYAGAVDIARDYDRPVAAEHMAALVDAITPRANVIIASLPLMVGDMGRWAAAFDDEIVARGLPVCDLRGVLDYGDLEPDGVHPTDAGDDKLAGKLWQCIR